MYESFQGTEPSQKVRLIISLQISGSVGAVAALAFNPSPWEAKTGDLS